ncbi:YSIRK-type signal peptide-containing protein, partial [Streptococcus gordonii]
MKDFRKVQEKIQKFSIRKLSVGVGSVAIAALIFGSFLTSPAVAADEVGKTGQAHYTYVEEQELTEQEKELIKHELPSDLQSGENYYLIYRKQGKPTVLPQTGNNGQPLLGILAGTAILAVLVFSRKKAGKLVGVLLIGAFGQSLLLSPQVFALENKELVSYNRQVPISSGVSEADLAIEGYDYIGYFTASDLRALTGTSPASQTEEISLKDQLAVPENSKSGRDARGQEKQTELMEEEKQDQDISSQVGSISDSTPNPSSQGLHPNKETSKEENKTNPNQSEKSSSSKGAPEVQPEKPAYTEPIGTAGDTAPVEPALPAYTGSVNGEAEVQPEKPSYTGPVGTAGDTAPVEPALPAYTGSVNGEPEVQPE